MAKLLTLDEIMAMAIQMEAGAAAFYRRAAGSVPAGKLQAMLSGLATTEEGHRQTFEAMRRKAAEAAPKAGTDPLVGEGGLFMAALASGIRVEGSGADSRALDGVKSADKVLSFAVDMEKEAVLFYVGMRDVVPAPDREWLDRIIAEEKQHLATLARELGRAKGNLRSTP